VSYRYFRIVLTGMSSDGMYMLCCAGIELYGDVTLAEDYFLERQLRRATTDEEKRVLQVLATPYCTAYILTHPLPTTQTHLSPHPPHTHPHTSIHAHSCPHLHTCTHIPTPVHPVLHAHIPPHPSILSSTYTPSHTLPHPLAMHTVYTLHHSWQRRLDVHDARYVAGMARAAASRDNEGAE
jgi:hypothetical protein